uniref:Uncharacterized protein n=1 Tax=Romanomermis culicivorax TaxID=13658 RepID=A0A915J2V6_ROMCU
MSSNINFRNLLINVAEAVGSTMGSGPACNNMMTSAGLAIFRWKIGVSSDWSSEYSYEETAIGLSNNLSADVTCAKALFSKGNRDLRVLPCGIGGHRFLVCIGQLAPRGTVRRSTVPHGEGPHNGSS